MNRHRPQIGKHGEQRPERQETGLGLECAGGLVEGGIAHRAEQHCVSPHDRGTGFFGKRVSSGRNGRGADREMGQLQPQPKPIRGGAQHSLRLGGDFRPDTVAAQHRDRVLLHGAVPAAGSARRRSNAVMSGSSSSVRPISSTPRSSMSRR